jgi:hypothetical protein
MTSVDDGDGDVDGFLASGTGASEVGLAGEGSSLSAGGLRSLKDLQGEYFYLKKTGKGEKVKQQGR